MLRVAAVAIVAAGLLSAQSPITVVKAGKLVDPDLGSSNVENCSHFTGFNVARLQMSGSKLAA
ncbi:exported hypothetical protein [Candidatus Sulfopaludibacter sp. SbA4]|nr:exported hypothetical protein [Candidatus Sulfopaludibacter sp. SbA4]